MENILPAEAFRLFSFGEDPVGDLFLDPIVSFRSIFPLAGALEFFLCISSISSFNAEWFVSLSSFSTVRFEKAFGDAVADPIGKWLKWYCVDDFWLDVFECGGWRWWCNVSSITDTQWFNVASLSALKGWQNRRYHTIIVKVIKFNFQKDRLNIYYFIPGINILNPTKF